MSNGFLDSKKARILVDDNDEEDDPDRETSDKQSRSSSPLGVNSMTPVTPMPLPLTTSSTTPSPESVRAPLGQDDVDDGKYTRFYFSFKISIHSYILKPLFFTVADSDTASPTPENLSLPKKCPSPSISSGMPYMSYHQQFHTFQQHHYQHQRSPVDVLIRAFPNRRRSDIEAVLQRCKGNLFLM